MARSPLPHQALPLLALVGLALALPVGASASPGRSYVPGEVLVKYKGGTSTRAQASAASAVGTGGAVGPPAASKRLELRAGTSVAGAVHKLRRDPRVEYAVPNYIAHASGLVPDDPAFRLQWNLSGANGINMPDAWNLAKARRGPGGKGVTVAVLDTGVAYQRYKRFRRAPDLQRFAKGYDFMDGDSHPNDDNGHGTHVAGTIAQTTGNKVGTAGIAYRAKIMPVRVLNERGEGDTVAIAQGIRYAARHGADVINLSLEFKPSVRAAEIPNIISALRYARRRGAVVVAAAGNTAGASVAYPARAPTVIGVSATTIRGCLADYSNSGLDADLAAPGGGYDAALSDNPYDAKACQPDLKGASIYQQTFTSSVRSFGLPGEYMGTSQASPHVSGVAALLIATKRLGRNPSPRAIESRLKETARDIGAPGRDSHYGYGLLDARAALR